MRGTPPFQCIPGGGGATAAESCIRRRCAHTQHRPDVSPVACPWPPRRDEASGGNPCQGHSHGTAPRPPPPATTRGWAARPLQPAPPQTYLPPSPPLGHGEPLIADCVLPTAAWYTMWRQRVPRGCCLLKEGPAVGQLSTSGGWPGGMPGPISRTTSEKRGLDPRDARARHPPPAPRRGPLWVCRGARRDPMRPLHRRTLPGHPDKPRRKEAAPSEGRHALGHTRPQSRVVLNGGEKKKCSRTSFPKKARGHSMCSTMVGGGW